LPADTRNQLNNDPGMGKHRRHTDTRRLLAAVQQRGSEENRVNTRARLLGNLTELCRIDPRPHRRIPRIHLQGCTRNHLQYLRPLASIRPRQRADLLSLSTKIQTQTRSDSIILKSATDALYT